MRTPGVLSYREREVLAHAANGLRNREISEALWLSEDTVKSHMHRISAHLGTRNRVQAVVMAAATDQITLTANGAHPVRPDCLTEGAS